jgi:hypothetical protein
MEFFRADPNNRSSVLKQIYQWGVYDEKLRNFANQVKQDGRYTTYIIALTLTRANTFIDAFSVHVHARKSSLSMTVGHTTRVLPYAEHSVQYACTLRYLAACAIIYHSTVSCSTASGTPLTLQRY